MDLSFKEKSIAGSLVITAVLFGYYFIRVIQILIDDSSEKIEQLPMVLLGVVVLMVIVEVVYHAVIALGPDSNDTDDERDRLIDAKSTRIAYFVLAAGSVTTVGHATLAGVFADRLGDSVLANPIMTANFVLLSFIVAEIIGFGMQLFYYRRGF